MRLCFVLFMLIFFLLISCSPVECVRESDCGVSEKCSENICRYSCSSNGWCPNEGFCIKGLCYSEACYKGDCAFDDSDVEFSDDDFNDEDFDLTDEETIDEDAHFIDYDFSHDIGIFVDIDMKLIYDGDTEQSDSDTDTDSDNKFVTGEISFEEMRDIARDIRDTVGNIIYVDEEVSDEDNDSGV